MNRIWKIGVVGSRNRDNLTDWNLLYKELENTRAAIESQDDDMLIVSGGCPTGADHMAEKYALMRELPITIYRAKWNKFGKAAGPRRNTAIAMECDELIAMPSKISIGTKDTMNKFRMFHTHGKLSVL